MEDKKIFITAKVINCKTPAKEKYNIVPIIFSVSVSIPIAKILKALNAFIDNPEIAVETQKILLSSGTTKLDKAFKEFYKIALHEPKANTVNIVTA